MIIDTAASGLLVLAVEAADEGTSPMEWLQAAAVVAAGVGGGAYLLRVIRKGFKTFEAMSKLVMHELQPNSGSSLMDKVNRCVDVTESTKEAVDEQREQLDTHLSWSRDYSRDVDRALHDLAHAINNGEQVQLVHLTAAPGPSRTTDEGGDGRGE